MDIIGKATINPVLFYTGKISGYITWIWYIIQHTGYFFEWERGPFQSLQYLCYVMTGLALLLIVISLINLGKSTRLGLPKTDTELKVKGIYSISRNPMYLGFDLLTLSSMIYSFNVIIIILGIFSIVVYHWIIKAEERFLEQRFGNEYINYISNTRRYL